MCGISLINHNLQDSRNRHDHHLVGGHLLHVVATRGDARDGPGKRFDRYTELAEHAFGSKAGYWSVMPQQMLVQVATDIVYTVTGGKSLKKCLQLIFPVMANIRQTYFILFFTGLQILLSQTPNFNSLKGVSLLAAVMSLW